MPSLSEIMEHATPVERVVRICVAGKLAGDAEKLRSEYDFLSANPSTQRLAGDTRLQEVVTELDAINEKMREATYEFRFRALSPKKWSDLMTAHPDPEKTRIFNPETFPAAAIAACCVEPEGMNDEEAANALLEKLSPAQQSDLFDAAWSVNVDSPKGLIF